ncbi:DUF2004 domain-containing protein [Thalassobellus sediminis]|uniref:DUF2004 domain-containing protein n=1 Tax=Thalassobellus sediminis TaxID=3367753 RepID=UPI00378A895F
MGIFDFFKKKEPEQKNELEDNCVLPYFGQVTRNNLEEYYSADFELNNSNIKTDLNFENKKIGKNEIEQIEKFLKSIADFDKKNKVYIEKDFNEESGESSDYINFYLDELDENELNGIIDIENIDTSKNIQLLNKLKLIRLGLYPDGKYGTDYFATFDYSIDINGEPCNQLLVVNTDEKGNLDHISWES